MEAVIGLVVLAILLGLYFLPTIIAVSRHKRNAVAIGALNFFLGWTLIGWVTALIWALAYEAPSNIQQQSHKPPAIQSSPVTPPPTQQKQSSKGTSPKYWIPLVVVVWIVIIGLVALINTSSPDPDGEPSTANVPARSTNTPTPVTTVPTDPTNTPPPVVVPTPENTDAVALGQALSSGQSVADVVEGALPSVVQVIAGSSAGTGFIVDADGMVITNRHVVGNVDNVTIRLATGSPFRGRVTRRHPDRDLAYIHIEGTRSFTPIAIGDSDRARVGEEVIAIGFPIENLLPGLAPTVSVGILSAKRPDFLQTDASINPGNSGGPLLNASGQVIGVVVSRVETDGTGRTISGIGFAVPVNEVGIAPSVQIPPTSTPPPRTPRPTPTPAPTFTPVPTPTPLPHPATFCREWESLVLNWIKEGNNYWVWDPDWEQFRSPFDPIVEEPPEIPELPRLSAREADQYCILDFPRSMIPSIWSDWHRYDKVEMHWGPVAQVGEGPHQYLPGTYEYRWDGGNWVEARRGCNLFLNAVLKIGDGARGWIWQAAVHLEHGNPFSMRLEPGHGQVYFKGQCEGNLYRIGE